MKAIQREIGIEAARLIEDHGLAKETKVESVKLSLAPGVRAIHEVTTAHVGIAEDIGHEDVGGVVLVSLARHLGYSVPSLLSNREPRVWRIGPPSLRNVILSCYKDQPQRPSYGGVDPMLVRTYEYIPQNRFVIGVDLSRNREEYGISEINFLGMLRQIRESSNMAGARS